MKKVLALILALSLSLACLAACGSNTGASPTPAASAAATTQPATPAESAAASPAEPELTDYVYLATQPVGTSYYALGTGIADLINSNTPINATVTPYSGPDEFMVDTLDGTVNMGLSAIMDLSWAYSGTVNYDTPYDNLRLVASGNWSNHATMTVLKSSDIQSIRTWPVKKSATISAETNSPYCSRMPPWPPWISPSTTASKWVSRTCPALCPLQEGRVDATYSGSPTAAAAVELNQSVGIRVLPFADLKPEDIKDGVPKNIRRFWTSMCPDLPEGSPRLRHADRAGSADLIYHRALRHHGPDGRRCIRHDKGPLRKLSQARRRPCLGQGLDSGKLCPRSLYRPLSRRRRQAFQGSRDLDG